MRMQPQQRVNTMTELNIPVQLQNWRSIRLSSKSKIPITEMGAGQKIKKKKHSPMIEENLGITLKKAATRRF